jgi:hypothetical protein
MHVSRFSFGDEQDFFSKTPAKVAVFREPW